MPDSTQLELIRASGLFDSEFYRSTYGHLLAGGEDPLRHFLATGLEQGHLPSVGFDPVLYRLLVPECGSENPLLHSMASGRPFPRRSLTELFPEITVSLTPGIITQSQLVAVQNHVYSKDAGVVREFPFTAGGKQFTLKLPDPGAFFDRLRMDHPFAFVRIPHGFWDSCWMVDFAESKLALDAHGSDLPSPQRRALAMRICASVRSNNGAFAPSFIEEVLHDISVHAENPNFFRAVSFTGYPASDDDVIGSHPFVPRDAILDNFARYFRPGEAVYDATLYKRWMITGNFSELPELCRDRPVVLVASDFFATLGERWALKDFTHVQIPRSLSQWQRWNLLARTSEAVAAACMRSGRPPIVLTQCGGSLAFWLITRLFTKHPRTVCMDLGQALNSWFFDVPELQKADRVRLYARSVIENCRLEPYYRTLVGAGYEEWLKALAGGGSQANRLRQQDAIRSRAVTGSTMRDDTSFKGWLQSLLRLARKGGSSRRTEATFDGNAVTGEGGTMQGDVSRNDTLDADGLVKTVGTRRPGLLDSSITDQAAGAVLLQAFQVIREQLEQAPEGAITVRGLGTFQVRNVERGDGKDRVVRKTFSFRLK